MSVEDKINELYEKVDDIGLIAGCKGCTKLNYLESTGTQYIDTGLKLSNNNKIYIEYKIQDYGSIFGAQFNGNGFTINIHDGNNSRFGSYSYKPYNDVNFDNDIGEKHNITYGKTGFYQDGLLLNVPYDNIFDKNLR